MTSSSFFARVNLENKDKNSFETICWIWHLEGFRNGDVTNLVGAPVQTGVSLDLAVTGLCSEMHE
jgi:hypothetical protein